MKTTGLFTTHRIEIDCEVNKPFKLIPFGDIHRDSDMVSMEYWQEFLDYAKDQKDAIFLGMGDYTDGLSTSERISLSGIHDTTTRNIGNTQRDWAVKLADELSFMKGRLIGLLGGNHYFQYSNGDTTDHILASLLGTKFLGVCSFIRLSLRMGKKGTKLSYDILAHHGAGGGKLAGSAFNKVEDMQRVAEADLFLMGHNHAKGCIPGAPRLTMVPGSRQDPVVRERVPWYGRTGSFLKAYEPGCVSYNVDAGRPPAALGWIEFQITPRRYREGKHDLMQIQVRGTA